MNMAMRKKNSSWRSVLSVLPRHVKPVYLAALARYAGLPEGSGEEALESYFRRSLRLECRVPVVSVGAGTCGLAAGAAETLLAVRGYAAEHKLELEIAETGCMGYCAGEPLLDIRLPGKSRLFYQSVTAEKVAPLLDDVLGGNPEREELLGQSGEEEGGEPWEGIGFLSEHPFFAPQTRHVLSRCGITDPASLEDYLYRGGYRAYIKAIHNHTAREIREEVKACGLAGRGGGGFPTAMKWELAAEQNSPLKYLVCNAAETDPGAFANRVIIESDPFRLLEGLAIAAYASGAEHAYIYIRREYSLATKRLKEAVLQATACGLIGSNILESDVSLKILIKEGAGAFVCGEETALIHSLEGKRGIPRPRPPYPAERGLFQRPTVVNNGETLASLPGLLNQGKDRFSAPGEVKPQGTRIFSLSGKIARPGVVEVPLGTPLRQILFGIGGGIPGGKEFKGVQIGGPGGGFLPAGQLDIPVDFSFPGDGGGMMGSGGLVVLDEDNCVVEMAAYLMEFFMRESCGKCIPCREGTKRMWQVLRDITRRVEENEESDAGERFREVRQLEALGRVIRDTSLCGLGKTAANPVLTSLRWFREEYEAHIFRQCCPSRTCGGMQNGG